MARRVSIKDVAQHAGVSWKTVSNVVNERPVVKPETRERVQEAIAELGYVPNHVGRDLRGGPTRTISLVVPELVNPYFARLAERMQVAARARGYTVSVEVSLGQVDTERAHVRGLASRPVDAVIISPSALTLPELVGRDGGPRVVLLGEKLPASADVVHVAIDNVASAADVVHHLVDQGRRRLLFIGADDAVRSTSTVRLDAFRAASRFAGLDGESALIRTVRGWTRESGYREMEAVLGSSLAFDAVVAGNDLLALGAMAALLDRGVDVPGEVAVVGWDDQIEAAWSRPALTSVAPDMQALVETALDAALEESEGALGEERVVPHALAVRASSQAPTAD